MMRSMFSGVSSLRVHQTRMDVIANNIANVNTTGFKAQRATFADAFYQNLQGASPPDPPGRAGTNPQQIGLGLSLASIDNLMRQGVGQRTDVATDVMIQGAGFFIVQNPDGANMFTRAGNIGRDSHWNLHINGMQLMGWSTRVVNGQHVVERGVLQPLSLRGDKQDMPAEPTTVVDLVGNLDITQLTQVDDNGNGHVIRPMAIFDSLGNRYIIDVRLDFHNSYSEASGSPHSYWTLSFVSSDEIPAVGDTPAVPGGVRAWLNNDRTDPDGYSLLGLCLFGVNADPPSIVGGVFDIANMVTSATLAFNSRGELVGMGPTSDDGGPQRFLVDADGAGDHLTGRSFDIHIVPISGVAPAATFGNVGIRYSEYGTTPPSPTPPTISTPTLTPVGTLTLDMTRMFQRAGGQDGTSLQVLTMDGGRAGVLRDISIGRDGTIMGRFSNGRDRVLGQIPLAFFINPAGLERSGNNLWMPTANSGPFDGVGLVGDMLGGTLEMSNVDLASEFTEMITTQRGFQAASRTITVSDEMLMELVNLRR